MKGTPITYSRAELAFVKRNCTMPIADLHAAFQEAFSRPELSAMNINSLRKRNGWRTGRTGCFEKGQTPFNKGKPMPYHPNTAATQFKRGQTPHNTNYLGHERVSKDGYVEISVVETNPHTGFERRYVLKHRHLWEKANGPIPDGHGLKCLDSNKLNTDPSNWECLPRSVLARLNGGRHKKRLAYDDAPAELKPTVMAVAKLKDQIKQRTTLRIQDQGSN